MSAQLEIFRPAATDPNVIWLADHLFEKAGWQTAREILDKIPDFIRYGEARIDDRTVRAWAEAAAPKIISGQRGYKQTDHATAEEIKMFLNTMHSQGVKMLKRAQKVRKYAHAKLG